METGTDLVALLLFLNGKVQVDICLFLLLLQLLLCVVQQLQSVRIPVQALLSDILAKA